MNQKASVSKELNDKHAKILEGLLKLPENRECADCKSKGPRWASINLGIFICLHCSGIHRSLGVHISKVRSTTLDTWLPEQVAFMEMIGNKKSNDYWEAEMSPQYNRSPIEKFIPDKYVEKKWASKTATQPTLAGDDLKAAATSPREIPRKARKYSLDEGFFTNVIHKTAPPARNRRGSFDLRTDIIPPLPNRTTNQNISSGNVDAASELFSLLYVPEENSERGAVPPSRWATFDCENTLIRICHKSKCHDCSLELMHQLEEICFMSEYVFTGIPSAAHGEIYQIGGP